DTLHKVCRYSTGCEAEPTSQQNDRRQAWYVIDAHETYQHSDLLRFLERTNAWHGRYRRNSKDYEHSIESSTVMIQISNIHLMLDRLSPNNRPAFHYRKDAA